MSTLPMDRLGIRTLYPEAIKYLERKMGKTDQDFRDLAQLRVDWNNWVLPTPANSTLQRVSIDKLNADLQWLKGVM